MLFDVWRDIVRERSDEMALVEAATGRIWTFTELDAAVGPRVGNPDDVICPSEWGVGFLLAVLSAWRQGQLLCPVEVGGVSPAITNDACTRLISEGCRHLKATSASTGPARWIAFTEEQLAADARNIVETMGLKPNQPNLGVISLAHSYGFSNLVLPLLLHGIPLILGASNLPGSILQAATFADEIVLPGVPALWQAWHAVDAIPKNVCLAISAGAPLPIELETDILRRRQIKVHNFYGASECGGIAYDRSEDVRANSAIVGTALKHVSLERDESGVLVVRGEGVARSYWPDKDPSLGDGCFVTNDLVDIVDGVVHLRGRVSEVINVAGRKVHPETVERALLGHRAVRDCLVLGLIDSDAGRSDVIAVWVELEKEGGVSSCVSVSELRRFLQDRLPAWQIPREWLFTDGLGVDVRGKRSRNAWRQKFLENRS